MTALPSIPKHQLPLRAPTGTYTVASYLVDCLVEAGVRVVYTVPGGTLYPILEAIARNGGIRTIVCKDEFGAAAMADGEAWATGELAAVLTIGGPGATGALTGISCSAIQRNPVVFVTSEVASSVMGRRAAQDSSVFSIDVTAMSRPATALSVACGSAEEAAFALDEGFRRAIQERKPVHIALPIDVQRQELPARACAAGMRPQREVRGVTAASVRRAAIALEQAQRIAFLVGNGARGAGPAILELAVRLGAPIATTLSGKGIIPERHLLSVGVFSFGGSPLARAIMTSGLDVLVAIGTGLGEFATMNYSGAILPKIGIVHIDSDPTVFNRRYECIPVCGDAGEAVAALARQSEDRPGPEWLVDFEREHPRFADGAAFQSDATPIRPERVMREIERALPPAARLVADIGTSCLFAAHYIRLGPGQRSYIPMGWSCMGHPLAAALGIRLGSGLPTLCVSGDAAFLSKGMEIHTAVEQQVSGFVCVVLANGGHGLVRMGTQGVAGKQHDIEVGAFKSLPGIAAIARALGAEGVVVKDPKQLASALKHGFECGRPCVIEVHVDPEACPPIQDRIETVGASTGGAKP